MNSFQVQGLQIKFSEYTISCDDFTVQPSEFFSILAPSGFGKTTLLRSFMGFQVLSSGSIVLNGKRIDTEPAHARNLGVVFQDHLLFPHLTAFENAVFGLKIRRKLDHGAILRAEEAFRALGLSERQHARVTELSGGERQRVALLRATLFQPECLLLDEPLKGLDQAACLQVVNYLQAAQRIKPIPVVWVSHQGLDVFSGGSIIGTERSGQRHFTLGRPSP